MVVSNQDKAVLEIKGRELLDLQLFRIIILVSLVLFVFQLSAVLKNVSQHWEILCLIGKDLNVLMCLRSTCFWSTIIEEQPFNCSKGKDCVLEIIFIQGVILGLKLFGNNKQVILIEVELIKQQSMCLAQLLNKKPLNSGQYTSSKGGKKGLRTSSFTYLYFCFSLDTSRNCIMILFDSTVWVCYSIRDYLDSYAFCRLFKTTSWIYCIRRTEVPHSWLQNRKPKNAPTMNVVTPMSFSVFFCVFYSQIHENFSFHYQYDDIIKIKIVYDARRILIICIEACQSDNKRLVLIVVMFMPFYY